MKLTKARLALFLFLLILTTVSFLFRFKGILNNHPFWIDEFSSADQSRFLWQYGLHAFNNPLKYFEHHNITTYFLIGSFFKLFGLKEGIARMPSVIIGSLIPLLVFILSRYFFNLPTAIGASLLTAFSYFEITWSRQARGYMLLQAITLLTLFLYLKITEDKNKSLYIKIFFIFTITLGLLTHTFFLVFILTLIINYVIVHRKNLLPLIKSRLFYLTCITAFALLYLSGSISAIWGNIRTIFLNPVNNLWYYHSFLWREYGLLTFLGLVGLFLGLINYPKKLAPVVIYSILHLLFISFLWTHYISKYTLPIFPFILIGVAYVLYQLSVLFIDSELIDRYIKKYKLLRQKKLFVIILNTTFILFILINGHKFVIRPKAYYSVNHDFREIAILEYSKIYGLIKQKGRLDEGKTAIIDTWPGRVYWYIEQDYQPLYIFRWKNEKITIIGQKIHRTPFSVDKEGDKIVPQNNNLRLLEDVSDLKKVLFKYPRGFIFIDDSSLPHDVITYAQAHFKKELYLDHYPLDDNPYSIWPATLYSWGIQ